MGSKVMKQKSHVNQTFTITSINIQKNLHEKKKNEVWIYNKCSFSPFLQKVLETNLRCWNLEEEEEQNLVSLYLCTSVSLSLSLSRILVALEPKNVRNPSTSQPVVTLYE